MRKLSGWRAAAVNCSAIGTGLAWLTAMAQELYQSEQRKSQRLRRLKDAQLVFNDRKSVMNCTVRNVSERGAKLIVSEPYLVPTVFELAISGAVSRIARKVWFKEGEMGVKFL